MLHLQSLVHCAMKVSVNQAHMAFSDGYIYIYIYIYQNEDMEFGSHVGGWWRAIVPDAMSLPLSCRSTMNISES